MKNKITEKQPALALKASGAGNPDYCDPI